MEMASDSDVELFRWIDSDVKDDMSITQLNTPGYYGGINMPCYIENRVYSGYYNWDVDRIYKDGSTLAKDNEQIPLKREKTMTCSVMKTNLDKLNPREKQLREIFWKIKEMRGDTNAKEGYVPEPIVYMNKLAHDAAISHLNGGVENHMKQDRESDKAFVNMPVKFMPDFSVSKPVKVSSSSGISYMGDADFKEYTNIRQSAFDPSNDWNLKDNDKANSIYNGARDELKGNEHVNVINVMERYFAEDGKQIDATPKIISDFNIGDVGFSYKYGWVKVDEDLQETNGVNGYDVEAKRLYVKTIGGHLISKGENIDDLVNSLSENIVVKRVYEEGKEKFCKVKKEVFLKPGSMETDFKFFVDENDKYYEVTKKAQSDEG